VELLLQSVDCLRGMLGQLQSEEPVSTEQSLELIDAFNAILAGDEAAKDSGGNDAGDGGDIPSSEIDSDSHEESTWEIHFVPDVNMLRTGNEPIRMFRELKELGTLTVTALVDRMPDFDALNPEECFLGWKLLLETSAGKSAIDEIFEWVVDDAELVITEVAGLFGVPASQPKVSTIEI